MPRDKDIDLRDAVATIMERSRVEELARSVGYVKRLRAILPYEFLSTLVFGFGAGGDRSLAELQRSYERATGQAVARSSFRKRFTPELVTLLKQVVEEGLAKLQASAGKLSGLFQDFRDVVAADGMVIKLRDSLASLFPGTRTNSAKAAAKVHAVLSVAAKSPKSISLTSERTSELKQLRIGPWVKDTLLLVDLGYYSYSLFSRVDRNDGFFVSRIKSTVNPLIITDFRKTNSPSAIDVEGVKLQEVLPRLRRAVLDLEVEVQFTGRKRKGKSKKRKQRFRLVGLRNHENGEYWLYLTNLPRESFQPAEIAQLYSARWAVELFFREVATAYKIKKLPSGDRHITESLIYAAILTSLASRRILKAATAYAKGLQCRLRVERLAAVIAASGSDILRYLCSPDGNEEYSGRRILKLLAHQATDPNKQRMPLLERVEASTQIGFLAMKP